MNLKITKNFVRMKTEETVKIGIIGPETCQKTKKVKELLFGLKKRYPMIIIHSGGNKDGIEKDVKKYALQFEMDYSEFNPCYTGWNNYSFLNENYFNKGFHISHEPRRYQILIYQSDIIFVGYEPEYPKWNLIYKPLQKYAEKKKKQLVFI